MGTVREQVYVGSMIKAIVVLPDGQEVRLERLAGDELPENGPVYLYWDPVDARTIKTLDQVFFLGTRECRDALGATAMSDTNRGRDRCRHRARRRGGPYRAPPPFPLQHAAGAGYRGPRHLWWLLAFIAVPLLYIPDRGLLLYRPVLQRGL